MESLEREEIEMKTTEPNWKECADSHEPIRFTTVCPLCKKKKSPSCRAALNLALQEFGLDYASRHPELGASIVNSVKSAIRNNTPVDTVLTELNQASSAIERFKTYLERQRRNPNA